MRKLILADLAYTLGPGVTGPLYAFFFGQIKGFTKAEVGYLLIFYIGAALVGEVWRVGTALLQISHVRIPCLTFKGWMGHSGYDAQAWVKRFVLAGRPGPYFRVLEEGAVQAGSPITVEDRPDHDVTVADLFAAVTIRPGLLPRVAELPGLKPWIYERAEAVAGRTPDRD